MPLKELHHAVVATGNGASRHRPIESPSLCLFCNLTPSSPGRQPGGPLIIVGVIPGTLITPTRAARPLSRAHVRRCWLAASHGKRRSLYNPPPLHIRSIYLGIY